MSPEVFAVVLGAALLHASWNAIVKRSGDTLLGQWLVIVAGSALCVPLLFLAPLPEPASWPWLAAAVALHTVYYLSLAESYRLGDLSQVYPLARGSAPLIVAAGAYWLVDETLSPLELACVALVCAGVLSLARGGARRPVLLALFVGCTIGAYSVVDGIGVRRAGSVLAYLAWLEVLCGIPISLVVLARRRGRVLAFLRTNGRSGVLAGFISTLAYAGILWAYSGAPLASVSALRETSVIFAAAIGALLLREPMGAWRIGAAALVAAGVALLNLA